MNPQQDKRLYLLVLRLLRALSFLRDARHWLDIADGKKVPFYERWKASAVKRRGTYQKRLVRYELVAARAHAVLEKLYVHQFVQRTETVFQSLVKTYIEMRRRVANDEYAVKCDPRVKQWADDLEVSKQELERARVAMGAVLRMEHWFK